MSEEGATSSAGVTGCLTGSFRIGKLVYCVTLSDTELSWIKKDDKPENAVCVPVEELLSVHHVHGVRSKQEASQVEGFTVRYVSHKKNHILRREFVQFLQTDDSQGEGEKWCEKIQEVVNTAGGRRNGKTVYETVAASVFKDAEIEAEVIVTERPHHCEEILGSHDLTGIDGIVLVGGDGMYHEAMTGLQLRLMKEAGKDASDATAGLQMMSVPIGLIPAGTGNAIATGCYGNADAETAALAILIGKTKLNNILSVHSNGELVSYAALLVGYGFWSDMMHSSDNKRYLGVLRYPVALLEGTILKSQREINLTVEYLPPLLSKKQDEENQPIKSEEAKTDQSAAITDPHVTSDQQESDQSNATKESESSESGPMAAAVTSRDALSGNQAEEFRSSKLLECAGTTWQSRQGTYTGACVTVGSLKVATEKVVPLEDCTRLLLNKPSGRVGALMFVVNMASKNHKALENPQVEHMFIKEFKIKVNNPSDPALDAGKKEHMLTLDGEIYQLKQPEFHVRFYPKIVTLFASTTENWCGENVK